MAIPHQPRGLTPSLAFGVVARRFRRRNEQREASSGSDGTGFLTRDGQQERYANASAGFSLLEMVIYVAILAVIAAVVVGSLLPLARSYREVVMALSINNAASAALERMVRDIRAASGVAPGSVFNTSPGVLVLTSTDSGGSPTTITFDVSGGAVRITEGAGTPYALTGNATAISSLTFTSQVNATTSTTIGIDITLSATVGQATRISRFVSSATLRNSY